MADITKHKSDEHQTNIFDTASRESDEADFFPSYLLMREKRSVR